MRIFLFILFGGNALMALAGLFSLVGKYCHTGAVDIQLLLYVPCLAAVSAYGLWCLCHERSAWEKAIYFLSRRQKRDRRAMLESFREEQPQAFDVPEGILRLFKLDPQLAAFALPMFSAETAAELLVDCCTEGDTVLAAFLLEHGVNPDMPERFRRSLPLEAARENGKRDCEELLLAHGANADLVDYLGGTPLHRAIQHAGKNTDAEGLERLLAQGHDVNAVTAFGHSALDLAVAALAEDAAVLLRRHGGKRGSAILVPQPEFHALILLNEKLTPGALQALEAESRRYVACETLTQEYHEQPADLSRVRMEQVGDESARRTLQDHVAYLEIRGRATGDPLAYAKPWCRSVCGAVNTVYTSVAGIICQDTPIPPRIIRMDSQGAWFILATPGFSATVQGHDISVEYIRARHLGLCDVELAAPGTGEATRAMLEQLAFTIRHDLLVYRICPEPGDTLCIEDLKLTLHAVGVLPDSPDKAPHIRLHCAPAEKTA